MKYRYIPLTLLSTLSIVMTAQSQTAKSVPRLVVNITIDQLRSDYLEAFTPLYTEKGFKKLLADGKVYPNASYPFSPIDRASAIATITTGTTPYYNSIVGERWLAKETLRPVYCVDDEKNVGLQTQDSSSPRSISTSTICDELKVATTGKALIYSVAPFRDAAVLSAGHAADGAFWIDDENGYWCSSSYYFERMPQWLLAYNDWQSVATKIKDKTWTPSSLISSNFSFFMGGGVQKPFSHKFKGSRRFREYKTSGMVNTDITDMAMQCVNSYALGLDGVTDILNLTYYAGNFDHKPVAECQMELQDTYVRLDIEIGRLIQTLENRLGHNEVLFIITGTGYCDEEQSDYSKYNIPTGTFYINRTANLLNIYFGGLWGQGQYVDASFGSQIFLNHEVLEQKHITLSEATARAKELVLQMSGVKNVYTAQQLISKDNPYINKICNGFCANRCGDLQIEVAPGWRLVNENNMDNQLVRASYIQFPIIIYGAGTKAERISESVTTDRIAPTIAKTIRIRAPNACSAEPLF